MAGKIPRSFIDDLLDRTDIVEVVNSRVPLKKTGKSHKACCPFHEEKTPSFSVAQDKQFYYCFGCGAGGNALSFIMAFDRLDFVPAVELLAKNVGLEVPREATAKAQKLNNIAMIYIRYLLKRIFIVKKPANFLRSKVPVDYLKSSRLIAKYY